MFVSQSSRRKYGNDYLTKHFYIMRVGWSIFVGLFSIFACVICYKLIDDLIISFRQPVRSTTSYEPDTLIAPAIVIFPIGAKFKACGHFEGVVTSSKAHIHDLELASLNCQFTNLSYEDPLLDDRKYPVVATVIRGPSNHTAKEVLYTHFQLEDQRRNFVVINYMIFENYDDFSKKSEEEQRRILLNYHKKRPAYSLSAGLRQWVKFRLVKTEVSTDHIDSQFLLQQSLAKYYETPDSHNNLPGIGDNTRLFFTFFEWETNLIMESTLVYTTTVWSVIASLCSILLALHKAYQIASMSFHSVKVSRRKRKQSKILKKQLSQSSNNANTVDLETGRITANSQETLGVSKVSDNKSSSIEEKSGNAKTKRTLFRHNH